jgi:hypothetical protein
MLTRHEPDNLANLPLGKVALHSRKCVRIDLLLFRQLRHIIQRRALGLTEQRGKFRSLHISAPRHLLSLSALLKIFCVEQWRDLEIPHCSEENGPHCRAVRNRK